MTDILHTVALFTAEVVLWLVLVAFWLTVIVVVSAVACRLYDRWVEGD